MRCTAAAYGMSRTHPYISMRHSIGGFRAARPIHPSIPIIFLSVPFSAHTLIIISRAVGDHFVWHANVLMRVRKFTQIQHSCSTNNGILHTGNNEASRFDLCALARRWFFHMSTSVLSVGRVTAAAKSQQLFEHKLYEVICN